MKVIYISGPDSIGKASNIRLLEGCGLKGVGKLSGLDISFDWCLKDPSGQEFCDYVIECLKRRQSLMSEGSYIVDGGILMFKFVCLAMNEMKGGPKKQQDREYILERFSEEFGAVLEILLLYDLDVNNSVQTLQERSKDFTSERKTYQYSLMDFLIKNMKEFSHVVISKTRSIIDINNEIREVISSKMRLNIKPLLSRVKLVVGLGGLSESGKSTLGMMLAERNFVRMKIGYLLDDTCERENNEERRAETIVKSLDKFSRCHYYYNLYSIESLHRDEESRYLKKLMGERYLVIYTEASEETRIARYKGDAQGVKEKDVIKRSRGAHKIKESCDVFIDTDRTSIQEETRIVEERIARYL
ncbi:hypothetical protein GGF37_000826 [Kickxella alabastrina]|nr:hypothetical protein GGF37_000826 [Kickxella alabastrina]